MQPDQHRETARILLRNHKNEFFLLLTHFDPEVGLPPRWITPGGGIDQGETPIQAAVRELREETGIVVSQEALGEQIGEISGQWLWGDGQNRHTYKDYFFSLTVADFELDASGWTEDEHRDVLEYRWWSIAELLATDDQLGPHGLTELIHSHF